VLTAKGRAIAPLCQTLTNLLERRQLQSVGLRKWALPTLFGVCQGCSRFSELKVFLKGITPRALAQMLRALEEAGLLAQVKHTYVLSAGGRWFCPILLKLYRALEQLKDA